MAGAFQSNAFQANAFQVVIPVTIGAAGPANLAVLGQPTGITLFNHLQMVQQFIGDQNQNRIDPQNLIQYVNRARRKVASQCQCLRIKSSVSGQIKSWTVTNGGHGYSAAPVCVIIPPDFPSGQPPLPNGAQAVATAVVNGGIVTGINNIYGGSGYFQPVMTITDPTGSGATVTPVMSFVMTLNRGQEVYNFADVDVSEFPGIASVYGVRSVSIIYSNYRYSLPMYSFSTYQSMIRQYPFQYQYVPTFCSQFGQGASGSLYVYPLPSQTYQMEWDMQCLPQDLTDDQSVEILQQPWLELPPYFAAHLAYAELQNFNASKYYLDLYNTMAREYSGEARIGRIVNPYGRY